MLSSVWNAGRTAWRDRLILADRKYVLPSLLAEFACKVNRIHIDPPFDVGTDFFFTASVPNCPDEDEDDAATFTSAHAFGVLAERFSSESPEIRSAHNQFQVASKFAAQTTGLWSVAKEPLQ